MWVEQGEIRIVKRAKNGTACTLKNRGRTHCRMTKNRMCTLTGMNVIGGEPNLDGTHLRAVLAGGGIRMVEVGYASKPIA